MPTPSRDSRLPLFLTTGLLIFVCAATLQHASLVIDHQRYYYLDDDQMISMRYARNLVDGQGLVWNAGDRVEGYTNLGWVMVMAVVHAAGVPERLTSLVVKLINIGLGVLILALADRLMRRLAQPPGWLRAVVLATLALSIDLVYWVVNGFETTLLTAVFLWSLVKMLDDSDRGEWSVLTCLLAGLLPIIRSDAADLTGVVIGTGFLLGTRRRFWAVILAVLPLVLHLAFRYHYYGDWLPNTYYLKVAGRTGLLWSGLGYVKGFVAAYPTVVVLAAGAAFIPGDRRARALLASFAIVALRVMSVGADMFPHYRFIAPLLPVLLALSAMAIAALADRRSSAVIAAVLFTSTVLVSGINGPQTLWLASDDGVMRQNVVAGWLINRNTRPEATVLVNAAGAVGYFSHRTAFDMLGKVDREIGHLAPHDDGFTGHNHYDIDKSLAHSPDLVQTLLSAALVQHANDIFGARPQKRGLWDIALVTNETFKARYLPHPVPVPYLLNYNSVFVRDGSPEIDRIGSWHVPELDEAEPQ
jgi:hypothetical protein